MAKCRSLLQENQELGKQISQGRVAQLEAELALQKKYNQEVKASQDGVWGEGCVGWMCVGEGEGGWGCVSI